MDLDAVDNNGEKCEVAIGVDYSNEAIRFFFNNSSLDDLNGYLLSNKIFNKLKNTWTNHTNGKLCVVYQIAENGYNAKSFEDAFIHVNRDFIKAKKENFKGLKNRNHFDDANRNAYFLAEECIKKKSHFALDILYHSNNNDLSNWQIPEYIKEGLLWLKRD